MAANNHAIGRYTRYLTGVSAEEIATEDGVSLAAVEKSLAKGAELENQRVALQVLQMRDQGALKNEELRRAIRDNYSRKAEEAINILLDGKNIAVETDNTTGAVTFREYTDPKILIAGLNQFKSFASMIEKPAPGTIINNNVQQNTQNNIGDNAFDFETSISKIREKQRASVNEDFTEAEVITPPDHQIESGDDEQEWSKF